MKPFFIKKNSIKFDILFEKRIIDFEKKTFDKNKS